MATPVRWIAIVALAIAGCDDSSGGDSGGGGGDRVPDAGSELAECGDTLTDPLHCGGCNQACAVANAEPGCDDGVCSVARCERGFIDGDGDPANGCEMAAACAVAGSRTGVHRSFGGDKHLYTSDMTAASTPPFAIEYPNYFFLAPEPLPAASFPVYLCRKLDGSHWLTSHDACEGNGTNEARLGYWSSMPECGAILLYRLYHPITNDHLFTTSLAEYTLAVGDLGFVSEGPAGYVWPAP